MKTAISIAALDSSGQAFQVSNVPILAAMAVWYRLIVVLPD